MFLFLRILFTILAEISQKTLWAAAAELRML